MGPNIGCFLDDGVRGEAKGGDNNDDDFDDDSGERRDEILSVECLKANDAGLGRGRVEGWIGSGNDGVEGDNG